MSGSLSPSDFGCGASSFTAVVSIRFSFAGLAAALLDSGLAASFVSAAPALVCTSSPLPELLAASSSVLSSADLAFAVFCSVDPDVNAFAPLDSDAVASSVLSSEFACADDESGGFCFGTGVELLLSITGALG